MKKLCLLIALAATYAIPSFAGDWDDDNYNYGPPQGYYPQPYNGYPPPQANYYPPQQQQPYYNNGNTQRSAHGLAGSVIGDVLGYELGNGSALTSGLGAAAGAYLGNGFGGF